MKKILLGLALLGACDSADRRAATVVANAVLRFRTADLAGTPAAVDTLKATPCGSAESCATKEVCVAAGEPLAQGLRVKGEVEKMIAKAERKELAPDSIEVLTMPSRLEQADALIKRGFEALPACDESMQALKRKHRF